MKNTPKKTKNKPNPKKNNSNTKEPRGSFLYYNDRLRECIGTSGTWLKYDYMKTVLKKKKKIVKKGSVCSSKYFSSGSFIGR